MTLAILADDLTGACDAAAPFARRGLETVVVLDLECLGGQAGAPAGRVRGGEPVPLATGSGSVSSIGAGGADEAAGRPDVLAVDADTRRLGERLAGARTGQAARALRAGGATLLYKKIDSTLRGHVRAELAATLRAWDAPLAIVCPAFPAVGRWVQGGHLFVDKRGDLGDVVEVAGLADAAGGRGHPPVSGRRPDSGRQLARVGLEVVGRGADALTDALDRARRDGARVVVADANTPGHLTALALAATRLEPPALLVGSAGLAAALAELWVASGAPARPALVDAAGTAMPWLVVCGSQTEVTRHQVVELARAGARVIELDVDELVGRRRLAVAAGREAARLLWAGMTPVLRLVVAPNDGGVRSRGPRLDDRAARALARACREAVGGAQPAGLFLTGGLTARACLLALEARGLRLEQEPLPGIAAGRALGGVWDGRAVVTKAGGFGAPDAIKRLVRLHRP